MKGEAGVGKSSLIRQLVKPITSRRGYFISGAFDQFHPNMPYSALVNAMAEMVHLLLTECASDLAAWRTNLTQAVGGNAPFLLKVFPSLAHLIKASPAPSGVGDEEAQHRFRTAFSHLIRALSNQDHPLVIFTDDLQWADPSSLALFQVMIDELSGVNLLIIGAYRGNEIDESHPLAAALKVIRTQANVTDIALGPLTFDQVLRLLSHTLSRDIEEVAELATVDFHKTAGNAFFCLSFLEALHREGLLFFESQARRWAWDISAISECDITDNAVDLVAARMRNLSAPVMEALMVAACIGTVFDGETLALGTGTTESPLQEALDGGLILSLEPLEKGRKSIPIFKFAHDRVRQAAYSLLPAAKKAGLHGRIGNMLWQSLKPEGRAKRLFEIVDHLERKQMEKRETARIRELDDKNRELEKTNAEILQAQRLLIVQEKMASLGTLTAGIAHEIRNPLNFIENLSDVMVEQQVDELALKLEQEGVLSTGHDLSEIVELISDLKQNSALIKKHGIRTEGIIHAMTEVAEGGGGYRLRIHINDLVKQYVELAGNPLQTDRVQLHLVLEKKVDTAVVEARNLGRALILLLKNAVDAVLAREAMGEVGYRPEIWIETREYDTRVAIVVTDNGVGIHKDHLDQVFVPFFTTKASSSQNIGLGLAIAYEIAKTEKGGDLEVISELEPIRKGFPSGALEYRIQPQTRQDSHFAILNGKNAAHSTFPGRKLPFSDWVELAKSTSFTMILLKA